MKKRSKAEFFRKRSVVVAGALLCCALWGSAFPLVKIEYKLLNINGAGSQILFGGYRFLLAGLLTLLVAALSGHRVTEIKRSSIPYICMQGLLQTTAQYVFFFIGLANATGARSSIINGSSSFFSIIVAHFLIPSEKMTKRKAIGCAVGFLGIIAMNFTPGGKAVPMRFIGEGFVLICSIAYGASSVTMKMISHREDTTLLTGTQFVFGSSVMIVLGLLLGGKVGAFTLKSALLLVYLTALSTVAFSLWAMLLKYNPVGKVAVFGFSIPVFGVLFSALLLGEKVLTVNNLLALALVSLGIIIVNDPFGHTQKVPAGSKAE